MSSLTSTAAGNLVIFGAGDHGLVVAEAAELAGWSVVGFLDDAVEPGTTVGRWDVLTERPDEPIIVAVGDNHARERVIAELVDQGATLASVVHPTAFVSDSAELGDGVFVGPMAIVHAEAMIGYGAVVNSHAIVEHHGQLHRCAHLAPNATLCGRVTVGRQSLIGAGAVVLPAVAVGSRAIVGAGAVVRTDVADGETVVGNPATPIG